MNRWSFNKPSWHSDFSYVSNFGRQGLSPAWPHSSLPDSPHLVKVLCSLLLGTNILQDTLVCHLPYLLALVKHCSLLLFIPHGSGYFILNFLWIHIFIYFLCFLPLLPKKTYWNIFMFHLWRTELQCCLRKHE